MSDQPLTLKMLAEFHREIMVPDIRRIVAETESRLLNRMLSFEDSILKRLGDLDMEYHRPSRTP